MDELITLNLKLPRDTDVTPESSLTFLSSLLSKSFALKILVKNQQIEFQIIADDNIIAFIESQIQSVYPLITIQKSQTTPPNKSLKSKKLILRNGNFYPIKTFKEFKDLDPLSSILSVLSRVAKEDELIIEYKLKNISGNWQSKALSYLELHPQEHSIKDKTNHPAFKVAITIFSNNSNLLSQICDSFNVVARSDGNSFKIKKFLPISNSQILNIEELATLWHLPSEKIKTTGINWGIEILSDPPHNLPTHENNSENQIINFFAKTFFKNKDTIFGIKDDDRRRHIWAIGKTGTGKSTLIANLSISDIKKKRGLAIIDPHGDLTEIIMNHIPNSRINDVVYFNPIDKEFPISINPLEVSNKEEAELVVSGIISIFSKIFGKFWGPRLEYILRNTLLTLVEIPGSTLKDVPTILTDIKFRKKIVEKIQDPTLKNFWENEFEKMPYNLQKESVFPILTRVGQFVGSPMIRGVIGNPKSSIDIEKIMNEGKILIANLSQGKLGEDNASLLGATLITKFQLAAMKRVNIPEEKRKDFYLYVDEFQNFATDSFIKILSEARKYRLNLILANQYMAQIPIQVQKAILGNIGTLISFATGAEDAHILKREFGEVFEEKNLIDLSNYQIAIKLMIDGHGERPFIAKTLPLPQKEEGHKEKIIEVSRQRWGKKTKNLV